MKKLLSLFVALIATITLWAGNTITYTATSKVDPKNTRVFGANIVNHTFSNGIGTITFDSDVTSIGDKAFSNCSGLTSITIPNSVTSIGSYAFSECSGLTSVTIPNSVTSIGDGAFYGCTGLTSVTIPNSVTSIGSRAFENCEGLISITIPNSVTSIGRSAFERCSALTSITIPNSVTSIGEAAFRGCSGFTSITIPNSVTSIEPGSFSDCSGLTSITIPNSVTSIGETAFWNCSGLTSITIPDSVTSIGNYAFCNCSGLTTVTIGNSVTSIEYSAFYGCTGLTSVAIPNSVTRIENSVFLFCSALTSITIPNSITSIEDGAFGECTALTSITIPDSVVGIGNYAFINCSSLTSVTIPESVEFIGELAFVGCSGLTSIIVDSGNVTYDSRGNCNAIIETASNTLITGCKNTIIPNSVTSIEMAAFEVCSNLVSITIPEHVTSIGFQAFYGCSGLTSITCEATTPPTCGSSCFDSITKTIPVYVPCGSVEAYRAAAEWSEFTNIIAIDCPARLEIPVTAGQWHYIAFPVEVTSDMIEYAGNGTWGYYDSNRRATGVSGWQNASFPLNANQGYIFYGDQTGTLYVNIDPASLPSGDQSITLTDYPSFHADNENWNFVGNPYYETYNVSHIAPTGMYLYVWNGTGYYYKEAGRDSYELQPLEAFFVQKKNTENSIDFSAASAGAAAPARAWAANSNRYIDLAAVAGGYTDYTRVVLNETASMDYTVGYDLAKFFSDEAPIQLFTLDAQSIECGVQELPNGVEEIALGYTVLESGEVVISTTDMEETYYLYDAETGITTDLRQSSYTFTAEAGTTVNRLSLRRAPGTATGVDGVNKYVNTITKVIREGQVLIQRGDRLYDLRGQEVK